MAITRDYKQNRSDLVCDKCEDIIASAYANSIDGAESQLPILEYRDQNFGHECMKCRKRRERLYDNWATNPGR